MYIHIYIYIYKHRKLNYFFFLLIKIILIQVLNDINSYFCKQCKKTFCLPHRYDFTHKCISDNKYKKGFFESMLNCF